jgi:glycosyltransferase involved in cell wall biosynthesis
VSVKYSIIVPVYNEEDNIEPLFNEIKDVLDAIGEDCEIIFIDDGSSDNSFNNILEINKRNSNVRIIKFRKNFGQTAAMDAGFKSSKGEIIISLDADMQNDPHDIPALIDKIDEGYDVISGWRYNKRNKFFRNMTSQIARYLRKIILHDNLNDHGCTLKAYRKECFHDVNLYGEMHRFIPAILIWKGYKVTEIKVNHRPRLYGKTKYSFTRVLKGFLDMLVVRFWMQYSARPIHVFGAFGILSVSIGVGIMVYLTYVKIFFNLSIGNRFILAGLMVLIGLHFIIFGVIADILIKMYFKNKSVYSIEKIIEIE